MKGRSAAAKAAAVCALAAALFLTQCDDGGPVLFPPYLTLVTHHINLGGYFQPVPGDNWFFYVMPAGVVGTEIVYVVQALPDGNRRAVFLNSALLPFYTYDSPYLGGAHLAATGADHLVGMYGFTYSGSINSISTSVHFQTATVPDPVPYRDACMVYSGGTYSLFTPTTMVGGTTQVTRYDFSYTGYILSVGAYTPYPVQNPDVPNRYFVLEGAGNDGTGSMGCLVLRDNADNRGYLFRFGTFPGVVDYAGFWSLEENIVSGTTRFAANGDPIIQLDSGRLQRWRLSDLGVDQGGDGHFYNGWYMAYGGSDEMYLFNPDSLELIETRAWWRDFGN